VKFHWDRHNKEDENSSCWIRVSQAWAGKGYGFISHPRIGHEVIVDFEEGDPDRPIVTGRVYNADQKGDTTNAGRTGKPGNVPPTSHPQSNMMTSLKSNSTPGGGGSNEIAMNDTKGGETLYFKAQKDEIHTVGNDREDTVGNNETRKVGVDRSRQVGNNETVAIGVNRDKTVGTNETVVIGVDRTVTVGANNTESIGANDSKTVGANQTNSVGRTLAESVGMTRDAKIGLIDNISAGLIYSVDAGISITLTAGVTLTLKGPGGTIEIGPSGIVIDGKTVTIKGMPVNINP
jgi:type VI secretion system secreted protein VgrG